MGFKYITYEGDLSLEIFIFPDSKEHAQVFRMMDMDISKVVGAGFVDMEQMICHGESVSMDKESTPRCTLILRSTARVSDWNRPLPVLKTG
jgi:hypothetical protein